MIIRDGFSITSSESTFEDFWKIEGKKDVEKLMTFAYQSIYLYLTPYHVRSTIIQMQYFCSFIAAGKNLQDVILLYYHSNLTKSYIACCKYTSIYSE
jgi:hypothetical protein